MWCGGVGCFACPQISGCTSATRLTGKPSKCASPHAESASHASISSFRERLTPAYGTPSSFAPRSSGSRATCSDRTRTRSSPWWSRPRRRTPPKWRGTWRRSWRGTPHHPRPRAKPRPSDLSSCGRHRHMTDTSQHGLCRLPAAGTTQAVSDVALGSMAVQYGKTGH